ncbi:MAG: peptide chain release factor N(5)-glutamine methyltransferase [Cytophagales bacterium]|nr:MAG: peptide chain release factor N(5)-glutamine methyltransferase [Cytophagales bacterium]
MENNFTTSQILFRNAKKILTEKLTTYSPEEISTIIYWGMEYVFEITKVQILSDIPIKITKKWELFIEKMLNNYPIQYFLEEAYFYKHTFFVNENVLIPRPETEIIIELILKKYNNQNEKLYILDIGTGSGCLAVSLALLYPNAVVFGIDISEEALKVAQKNANTHQVNVRFECLDMQKIKNFDCLFDIIVSNPPYICEKEKITMEKNVLNFEPHLALFVPDDNALIFYKAVMNWVNLYLRSKGSVFVEINQNLGEEVKQLFENNSLLAIQLHKDYFDNDRIITAVK